MLVNELPSELLSVDIINIDCAMVCYWTKRLFHQMRELNFINWPAVSAIGLHLDSRVLIDILCDPRGIGAILRVENGLSSIQGYNASPIACGQAFVIRV